MVTNSEGTAPLHFSMLTGQWKQKGSFAMYNPTFCLFKILNCCSLDCHHNLTPVDWGLTWRGLRESLVEPVGLVPFRAPNSCWNQSPGLALLFMAQPCDPPVHSLALLTVWSQVPRTPWALSHVFWNTERTLTRNSLSQLHSQTVSEVEGQKKPYFLLLL